MFKKLKELLEAGKISEEVAKALDEEIGAALKEVRDEAASWRVKYKELQRTYEDVAKSKESLEAQLAGIDEKIKKAKEEGKSELVKELEAERAKVEELSKSLNDMESKVRTLKIENELSKAIGNYKVIDPEVVAEVLKNRVDLVDGEVRFRNGEELLPLEDGVKRFFEAKPNLLASAGNSGSGAGNTTTTLSKKKSEMSDEEIEAFVQAHGQEAFLNLP